MSVLRFQLFGKFLVKRDDQKISGLEVCKEQELLSYLLLHRNRPHPRESLASLLWANTTTERSKKYLRQALWHVVSALQEYNASSPALLQVEHDWVQLNLHDGVWADVAVFDRAFAAVQGIAGRQLDSPKVDLLEEAVKAYNGELLEGWYQDWCLFERERLQNAYLTLLDKLMDHAVAHGDYEAGQGYGATILSYDRASERTYRRLMRLQYHGGDRTGALRQYQRCVTALSEELSVKPERRTQQLYEEIKADTLVGRNIPSDIELPENSATSLPAVLGRLRRLHSILNSVQHRLQRDIGAVEQALKTKTTK
ncbi:MAG TPA: BTAD domain-containing putative transcriptional regulator [Pyrinomonadaceae bacterium]|jgi:DNA-binding SARP family transcriptional activator|nr:BTAD domain-containing putative transcriptional regulator [Pyrinomonadaceae bacterium]